jgi:peptidoglycan hydrolase-like protein with peptidoglycan-binding domain
MKVAAAALALLVATLSASAQDATPLPRSKPAQVAAATATGSKPARATTRKSKQPAAAANQASAPAARALAESYAGIPLGERIAIQSDLVWATDYKGFANGDFDDRAVAAIKAFQKRFRSKETGILNPQEREALAAAAKERRDAVGWRVVDDPLGGGRVGVPTKLVSPATGSKSGSRWASAHGETVIETFRISGPNTTLAAVFDQQRKEPPDRRVEFNVMRDDFFVISGLQGLKKFYLRAQIKDGEVRGITVLYDQAVEGTVERIAAAVSSTFLPFSTFNAAKLLAAPTRKVEYSTGIVVSGAGHILASRQMTEGCHIISVPKLGNAERLAEDQDNDLALLRVYGARDLVPLVPATEAPSTPDVTLVGIADPQAQNGGGAVSTASARLGGGGNATPALGFSGAAAIDKQGRLVGLVSLKPQVVAGAGPANLPPAANVVPAESVRDFLEAQGVPSASGPSGVDEAKASVVRVICVRK